jgi:hypothetical protein
MDFQFPFMTPDVFRVVPYAELIKHHAKKTYGEGEG